MAELIGGSGYDDVQNTAPSNPSIGDTWLDTSSNPPVSKVYADLGSGGEWTTGLLDQPVSEAGAGDAVRRHDIRFVEQMAALRHDRSMQQLNYSDGLFDIFTSNDKIIGNGTDGYASVDVDPSLFHVKPNTTSQDTGQLTTSVSALDYMPEGVVESRPCALSSTHFYYQPSYQSDIYQVARDGSSDSIINWPNSAEIENMAYHDDYLYTFYRDPNNSDFTITSVYDFQNETWSDDEDEATTFEKSYAAIAENRTFEPGQIIAYESFDDNWVFFNSDGSKATQVNADNQINTNSMAWDGINYRYIIQDFDTLRVYDTNLNEVNATTTDYFDSLVIDDGSEVYRFVNKSPYPFFNTDEQDNQYAPTNHSFTVEPEFFADEIATCPDAAYWRIGEKNVIKFDPTFDVAQDILYRENVSKIDKIAATTSGLFLADIDSSSSDANVEIRNPDTKGYEDEIQLDSILSFTAVDNFIYVGDSNSEEIRIFKSPDGSFNYDELSTQRIDNIGFIASGVTTIGDGIYAMDSRGNITIFNLINNQEVSSFNTPIDNEPRPFSSLGNEILISDFSQESIDTFLFGADLPAQFTEQVTLNFVPSSVVATSEQTNLREYEFRISDGDGNSITVLPNEQGTEVDTSSFTDNNITVDLYLDNNKPLVFNLTNFLISIGVYFNQ